MYKRAQEVKFVSPHSSPNYDKLNAVDIGVTQEVGEKMIKEIHKINPKVIAYYEPKNTCLHVEIPQNGDTIENTSNNRAENNTLPSDLFKININPNFSTYVAPSYNYKYIK
jgi:hypothetical protein